MTMFTIMLTWLAEQYSNNKHWFTGALVATVYTVYASRLNMQKSFVYKYFGNPKPNLEKTCFFHLLICKLLICKSQIYAKKNNLETCDHYGCQLLFFYCFANLVSFFSQNNALLWISNEFYWTPLNNNI